ncbi:peroxiredoxin family protein [Algoriphagus boritolerans]|uniref:peroxiredoxin family protein n=1 Tax=Algoriphagus boritolerans TaxID=308111 RepID=UPI000A985019
MSLSFLLGSICNVYFSWKQLMLCELHYFFSIILLVLLLSGAWFGFSRYSANLEQRSLVVNLPSIEVSSMEGRSFYLREQIGTPLILIYFNSTCPICQSEAELIRKVFSEEQKVTFIWISSETVAEVKDFRDRYDFANLSNHTFFI